MPSFESSLFPEAARAREVFGGPVVAITGSNGKTTTKRMIGAILSRRGKILTAPYECAEAGCLARYMVHLGEPYWAAVFKVGATSLDGMKQAATLLQPDVAVVTNVGEAHMVRFGSVQQTAEAKAQLIANLRPEGTAVLNKDNEFTSQMGTVAESKGARAVKFGVSSRADVWAADIEHLGPDGTRFRVVSEIGDSVDLHMPIYSLGDVYNALAAVTVAQIVGVPSAAIKDALENDFSLPSGRGRLLDLGRIRLIDDTYDANPQSLVKTSATLVNFARYSRRLVMVLGEMDQVGENTAERHRMSGHYLAKMPIDVIVCVGDGARPLAEGATAGAGVHKAVLWFDSLEEASDVLRSLIRDGDTVLVEGSAKLNMATLIEDLVAHFADSRSAGTPAPTEPL
ncbi:MAG: UDP-N-acetylmuramoyl-tripeptide--D-alanyl-D-alanine ligase [Calditrichaeota bacterium]|nr:UDP-N-acetylmuramoyl-tripeptide--D-alanyl-D-alanine ligase [Calditrichota bacterium]